MEYIMVESLNWLIRPAPYRDVLVITRYASNRHCQMAIDLKFRKLLPSQSKELDKFMGNKKPEMAAKNKKRLKSFVKDNKETIFINNLHRIYKKAFKLWKGPSLFVLNMQFKESIIVLEKMRQRNLDFVVYELSIFSWDIIEKSASETIRQHKAGRYSKAEREKINCL